MLIAPGGQFWGHWLGHLVGADGIKTTLTQYWNIYKIKLRSAPRLTCGWFLLYHIHKSELSLCVSYSNSLAILWFFWIINCLHNNLSPCRSKGSKGPDLTTRDKQILLVLSLHLDIGWGTEWFVQRMLDWTYSYVIVGAIASQNTSLTTVYSTVYSGVDKKKHQSSASLAFVRGIHRSPVNYPHKWPVTRRMFSFDDVIMD